MGRQLNVLCGSKPQSRLHYMTATLFHCCGPKPPGYRLMHRSIGSASTRPRQLVAQDASGCGPKRNGSRQSTRLRREVAGFEARPAARAAGSSIHPARHSHDRSELESRTNDNNERRCAMSYLSKHGTRRVPQWLPLAGQVANSAGGHAWAVDVWTRLRRFLVLGSEGGSYYASEWTLTRENAKAVEDAVRTNGLRAVAEIVTVSREGRAPKNDPALYALALAAGVGDDETRKAALTALPQVARTGTHLFQFAAFVDGFRGWGRSLRRAVGRWYADQPAEALAYQAVKYRQRAGVSHRDLLRLSHPAGRVGAGNPTVDVTDDHTRLFEWIVRGGDTAGLPGIVEGFARAQSASTAAEAAALVREYRLPREALQPEHLTSPEVWSALLEEMPMTALVRNLATMTRVGVVASGSDGTARVVAQLGDVDRIRRARVHPIAVLAALRTYAAGQGARGRGTWAPVREVVDALDDAFYMSFGNVEPAGTRLLLALDVSGS